MTNLVNGKRYVGLTLKGAEARWEQHLKEARRARTLGILYSAIRKYGQEAFNISVIGKCKTPQEAGLLEREMIAALKPEYNISRGGLGRSGPFSLVQREKFKGRPGYWTGKRRSAETIAKIKATKGAAPPNLIGLAKLREHHAVAVAKAAKLRSQPILCMYDGRQFENSVQAAAYYGISYKAVRDVLNGRYKSAFGLTFQRAGG